MKCSLGISDFLEEIYSLSHSVVSLCFFALITEQGFLISPFYSLELCIRIGISFLFCFAFSLTYSVETLTQFKFCMRLISLKLLLYMKYLTSNKL